MVWLTPANMVVGFFTVGLDLGPVTTQVPLLEDLFGPETGGSLVQVGRDIHESAMLAAFVAGAACLALRLRRARGDERIHSPGSRGHAQHRQSVAPVVRPAPQSSTLPGTIHEPGRLHPGLYTPTARAGRP